MLYLGTGISTRISIKTFGRTTPFCVEGGVWANSSIYIYIYIYLFFVYTHLFSK